MAGRSNLVDYQHVARLLRFARNDNIGVLQRSHEVKPALNPTSSVFSVISVVKKLLQPLFSHLIRQDFFNGHVCKPAACFKELGH